MQFKDTELKARRQVRGGSHRPVVRFFLLGGTHLWVCAKVCEMLDREGFGPQGQRVRGVPDLPAACFPFLLIVQMAYVQRKLEAASPSANNKLLWAAVAPRAWP